MRIKIILEQSVPNQLIPINYQYPISACIFKIISSSNSEYADWLHRIGYKSGYKRFKMFTFSNLFIRNPEVFSGRIAIKEKNISFEFSTISDKTIENVIIGLFKNQRIDIHTTTTKSGFLIKTIECIPQPEFKKTMIFRTLSPIVLSKKVIYNEKESAYFLKPEDEDYVEHFKRNIFEKYLAYTLTNQEQINDLRIEDIDILGSTKSKLITIKEGTPEEHKMKGYLFDFKITGSIELIKLCYETGFGTQCSLGMGCVRAIN